MSDQIPFVWENTGSLPADHAIPGAQEMMLQVVTATFDGTSAASSFLPCLQVIGPSGLVVGTFVDQTNPIAAGGVVECTFGPFLRTPSATSSGGGGTGVTFPPWVAGHFYQPQFQSVSSSFTGAGNTGYLTVFPIWVPNSCHVDLSTYVTVTAGGQTLQFGLWKDNGFGYPGALVVDSGQFVPGATGEYTVGTNTAVTPSMMWVGTNLVGNAIGVQGFGGPTGGGANLAVATVAGSTILADAVTGEGLSNYFTAGFAGALPDPFPAGKRPTTSGASPGVWIKVHSVP